MKEIVVASGNNGKLVEVEEILDKYKIIGINEFNINKEVKEDGKTFEENAIKKAKTISKELRGKICLADDSGIEIEVLGGFPGVKTRRWLEGTDRQRNLAIIEKMKEYKLKEQRRMKFTTAICVSDGEKNVTAIASINGYVAKKIKGENGFGFDEIFELEDGRTLAELSAEKKNEISARKKALEIIKDKLKIFD